MLAFAATLPDGASSSTTIGLPEARLRKAEIYSWLKARVRANLMSGRSSLCASRAFNSGPNHKLSIRVVCCNSYKASFLKSKARIERGRRVDY